MKNILVFGGSGLVGSKFLESAKNIFVINAPNAEETDILNQEAIKDALKKFNPDIVINFAAYTDVQKAEEEKDKKLGIVYKINALGAKNIANACKELDLKLIHISTDYVFEGTKSESAYTEEDLPNPVNWYGQTKFFGEEYVSKSGCDFTIVRISMPFTSYYGLKRDIARFFLNQLKENRKIKAITDQKVTPTYTQDIADALIAILHKGCSGIYHVVSKNPTNPFDFAIMIAKSFGLDTSLIRPITLAEYNKNKKAKLLKYSWLDPTKFEKDFGDGVLHTIEESVELFKEDVDEMDSN